jgi:hypothetical protein
VGSNGKLLPIGGTEPGTEGDPDETVGDGITIFSVTGSPGTPGGFVIESISDICSPGVSLVAERVDRTKR